MFGCSRGGGFFVFVSFFVSLVLWVFSFLIFFFSFRGGMFCRIVLMVLLSLWFVCFSFCFQFFRLVLCLMCRWFIFLVNLLQNFLNSVGFIRCLCSLFRIEVFSVLCWMFSWLLQVFLLCVVVQLSRFFEIIVQLFLQQLYLMRLVKRCFG